MPIARVSWVWMIPWLAASLCLAATGTAGAADPVPGPVSAEVLAVIDGDTLAVRAHIWPGHVVEIRVRLSGIDAPERRGGCPEERLLAARAGAWMRARAAGEVLLFDIRLGKYAGRVVARVAAPDGTDLAAGLLAAGLARPYDGGTRADWCGELSALSD